MRGRAQSDDDAERCRAARSLTLPFSIFTEKTWKVLEAAIHEINNHNASGLSFEELYR